MQIKKIIDDLFSEEMAEYLIKNISDINKYDIVNAICNAPVSIERKIEMLESLVDTKIDKKDKDISLESQIGLAKKALSDLEETENCVYMLIPFWWDEEWCDEKLCEGTPYPSYQKLLEGLKKEMELEEWKSDDENLLCWYKIEKWKIDDNGDYRNIINYTFAKGVIMYFEYIDCPKEKHSYTELNTIDFGGFSDLNVPTFFRPGDVGLIDCRPFAPSEPVLVLENFDNRDCCGLQAVFFDENGNFDTGAIKHAHISPACRTNRLSALYRIKKVDYTFEGEKQILERIRNYIKNDDVKAREIWNCINGYSSDKKKISSVKEMEEFLKIKEKELC